MSKKKTHEEYVAEVAEINPNIEVVEQYVNAKTRILHRCKIDGYEWYISPSNALHGYGCPKCANTITKTHEEYESQIKETRNDIAVIEKYVNARTPILHKCNICGHKWKAQPTNVLSGHQGCPVCCGNIIGDPPEYKNSIWASKHREYFSKYLTEEQMKTTMPFSNKKMEIKCPDCRRIKMISPNTLIQSGLGCICGDGQSYANKFMYALLNQLNDIEYDMEYSPTWADKKRYDVFISKKNCIIENHGIQHYNGWNNNKSDLEKQQENDEYKKKLAIKNGIINYITLDCRYSNIEWIKKSIMDSQLPDILNFTEKDIDWNKCNEFAMSNLVFIASKLWNEGLTVNEISEKLKIASKTTRIYLKKGNELELCIYSPGDGVKRLGEKRSGSKHPMAKKVVRLSDTEIYETIQQCATDNNIHISTVTNYCKKQKRFMYYDEWLKNIKTN